MAFRYQTSAHKSVPFLYQFLVLTTGVEALSAPPVGTAAPLPSHTAASSSAYGMTTACPGATMSGAPLSPAAVLHEAAAAVLDTQGAFLRGLTPACGCALPHASPPLSSAAVAPPLAGAALYGTPDPASSDIPVPSLGPSRGGRGRGGVVGGGGVIRAQLLLLQPMCPGHSSATHGQGTSRLLPLSLRRRHSAPWGRHHLSAQSGSPTRVPPTTPPLMLASFFYPTPTSLLSVFDHGW
jgi:hypothetical protein